MHTSTLLTAAAVLSVAAAQVSGVPDCAVSPLDPTKLMYAF